MKFSVCIDALFPNNIEDGFKFASDYGFAVEFWLWWNKDIEKILYLSDKLNVEISAFCTRFVPLTIEEKRQEYLDGLVESIGAAKKLRCKTLISQVGNDIGNPREKQRKSIVDGLKNCVPYLEENGITLVIEPLNDKINHPGYYLTRSDEAFDIVKEVNSDNVKVLFDIYHQQITEGDVLRNMLGNLDKIGHIHAAGSTGRNELYLGELNYEYIVSQLEKQGYNNFFGLEYKPTEDVKIGLDYVKKLGS